MQNSSVDIKYRIVRTPPKKTVSMRVVPVQGGGVEVVVRAANRVSSDFIDRFLEERRGWIQSQAGRIAKARRKAAESLAQSVAPMSRKDILGRFDARYAHMLAVFGLSASEAPKLSIRAMRSRWGSFRTGTYSIALNAALARTNDDLLDYVIAHELSHRKHLHHGPSFYAELAHHMPDWQERRRALRALEPALLGHRAGDM